MLILPEDEVHLWFAFTGDFADPEFAARGILFPAETARMERLRRAEARSLFALSRILVRTTLSRYFPVSPEAWRFAANAYGKPLLNPPKNSFFARFSLSHTGGLAVFAVMREAEVGVDAERTDRAVDAFRLSRRFFSPEEAAHLRKLPPEGSSEGFFHLWTLKESFLKALGRGFSLPMNTFAFRLSDDRPRRISLAGDAPRIGEGWRFILIHIAGKMVVAVSASSPGRAPLKAVCRRILPSGDAADLPWEQAGLSEGMLHHPSGEDDCRA